jgi:nicotinate-nucleotide pyrophosphorylase (carboxylating)
VTDINTELKKQLIADVRNALAEDIGGGDLTAELVPAGQHAHATLISRDDAVICGTAWCDEVFTVLSSEIEIEWHIAEGDVIAPGNTLCELTGPARALLTGERTAMNFLQTLSGTATTARNFVDAVADTNCTILDTRKTLPGLRLAQKYAVRTGGAANHRTGLYDGILIKENHITAAGGIVQVLARAREINDDIPIQLEVESIEQLEQALASGTGLILLDNFTTECMAQAVTLTAGRAKLEASGGITLRNVREIAETGVDRISIGDLTKDITAIDLSMRFVPMD